jgi:hypothetical protein
MRKRLKVLTLSALWKTSYYKIDIYIIQLMSCESQNLLELNTWRWSLEYEINWNGGVNISWNIFHGAGGMLHPFYYRINEILVKGLHILAVKCIIKCHKKNRKECVKKWKSVPGKWAVLVRRTKNILISLSVSFLISCISVLFQIVLGIIHYSLRVICVFCCRF